MAWSDPLILQTEKCSCRERKGGVKTTEPVWTVVWDLGHGTKGRALGVLFLESETAARHMCARMSPQTVSGKGPALGEAECSSWKGGHLLSTGHGSSPPTPAAPVGPALPPGQSGHSPPPPLPARAPCS